MPSPNNIILILLSIGLFFTFSSPQYEEMKRLQASADEYSNVLDNVSRIAESRDALLVNYEAIPLVQKERLNKVLPDTADTVRLALDLDTIASRYGIAVKDVTVDTRSDPNSAVAVLPNSAIPYEKATVTFRFASNYQNFMRMLFDLERSLRIMDVKTVTFRTTENGFYDHEVKVETYWLK